MVVHITSGLRENKGEVELSVVSPVYMGEDIVSTLVEKISSVLESMKLAYEIILVEDGSKDNSWLSILEECTKCKHVKGVKLSRNFGQHVAISAGLEHAQGNWTVVMDCDLQDDPKEIQRLYAKALEGYDVVLAQRLIRQDSKLKKLSSKLFYRVFGYLTGTEQDSTIANFGIYSRKVTKSIINMGDYERYFPAMVQWVGFNRTKIPVRHSRRHSGRSSYSIKRLLLLAGNNIIAFSDKPLRLTAILGFGVASLSFLLGLIYLGLAILGVLKVSGFATIIISLYFSVGCIIFTLGLVGLYVGKSFDKSKGRPLYIIDKTANNSIR